MGQRYLRVQGGDLQDKHLTQGLTCKLLFPEHARCDPAKPRCVQRAGRSHLHTARPCAASHRGGWSNIRGQAWSHTAWRALGFETITMVYLATLTEGPRDVT